MKLTLAQIRIEEADVEGNVGRAVEAIETAAGNGADCVALPETFNAGTDFPHSGIVESDGKRGFIRHAAVSQSA